MGRIDDKLKGQATKLARGRAEEPRPAGRVQGPREGQLVRVPVSEIEPDPDQPRRHFDDEALAGLAASIAEHGVLQPLIVRLEEGRVRLIAGERRLRAARMAGLETVPCVVSSGRPAEVALIENLQRVDLSPIEEAEALARMRDEHGYTLEQLGRLTGRAKSTISETLSLNGLPELVKADAGRQGWPKRMLIEMAKQKTPQEQTALAKKVKAEGLKSDQVKAARREKKAGRKISVAARINRNIENLLDALDMLAWQDVGPAPKVRLIASLVCLQERLLDLALEARLRDARAEIEAISEQMLAEFGASNPGGGQ